MISSFLDNYDVLFVDLWGVTHNGKTPFPGSMEVFKYFKDNGKHVYLLSNAPRMPDAAIKKLTEMGVPRHFYDDLMTSGFECHNHLKDRPDDFYNGLGKNLFHLGPERDKNLFTSLDYTEVSTISDADFILITGTEKWDCTLADYEEILKSALEKSLPAICANPDLQVFYGNDLVLCSGSIAKEYERMGGTVRYHGKPDTCVYETLYHMACTQTGQKIAKEKILMVGDSLRTDIKGANNFGIHSLLVLTGLHGQESPESLKNLSEKYQAFPTHVKNMLAL